MVKPSESSPQAYGIEKSAVSEHFIEASRAKLKEPMERRLDKLRLCALTIDATPFEGQQTIVALGIGCDGRKTILGIRQGATENATVVSELLADPMERGLDFSEPRLYVLDGGKALHAAVRKYAGGAPSGDGADPALSGAQAAQRTRLPRRRAEARRGQKAERGVCARRLRGREASARWIAP